MAEKKDKKILYCDRIKTTVCSEKLDDDKKFKTHFLSGEDDKVPLIAWSMYDEKKAVLYVPTATANLLAMQKGLKIEKENVLSQVGEAEGEQVLTIPSVPVLHYLAKKIVAGAELKDKATQHDLVLFCLCLFTSYPGLAFALSEYLMEPDENVHFEANIPDIEAYANEKATYVVDKNPLVAMSRQRLRATVYYILYSKDKSYQDNNHCEDAFEKRLNAINAILYVKYQRTDKILPFDKLILRDISGAFDPYPKLKTALYLGVKLCEEPEMNNLLNLMAWNQLGAFKLGYDWVFGEKSRLHIDRSVLGQTKIFFTDFKRMRDEVGQENLPYYKYLHPTKSVVDANKYPDVIEAGKKKHFVGDRAAALNLFKLKSTRTVNNFDSLFDTPLPKEAYKSKAIYQLTEEETKEYEELMDLDFDEIKKLQGTPQTAVGMDPGVLNFLTGLSTLMNTQNAQPKK